MPTHTTKGRTITNFKTKNNQKIKVYGRLTTNELKKKHSFRPFRGAEMGSCGGEDWRQGSSWRTRAGKAAAGRPGSPTVVHR